MRIKYFTFIDFNVYRNYFACPCNPAIKKPLIINFGKRCDQDGRILKTPT